MRVIIFLLSFITYSFANKICPPKESIVPCTCIACHSPKFVCEGPAINEETLTKVFGNNTLSNGMFEIWLEKTAVKKLSKSQFGQNSFYRIHIYNNEYLSDIDPDTFESSKDKASHIQIGKSTNLSFKTMLDVIHNLPNLELIDLFQNNITEIPEKAFQPRENSSFGQRLSTIYLQRNNIVSIGSFAFYNLSKLTNLYLDKNQINKIDSNGLTFNRNNKCKRGLFVQLAFNNLTENSFQTDSIKNTDMIIYLEIAYNPIKYLPEQVFKQYVHKNIIHLYAYGVNFTCDCQMKWILSLPHDNKLAYHHVKCNNLHKRYIFYVNANELGKCN